MISQALVVLNQYSLAEYLGVSEKELKKLVKSTGFPPHIRLARNRWLKEAIDEWLYRKDLVEVDTQEQEELADKPDVEPLPRSDGDSAVLSIGDDIVARSIHRDMVPIQYHIPCVYFLIYENSIVYVGKTKSLQLRLYKHKLKKKVIFESVFWVESFSASRRTAIEVKYIDIFKPKYNEIHPNKKYLKKMLDELGC